MQIFNTVEQLFREVFLSIFIFLVSSHIEIKPNKTLALKHAHLQGKLKSRLTFNPGLTLNPFLTTQPCRSTGPGSAPGRSLCCVLGQDTVLSQCPSPPRSVNGYQLSRKPIDMLGEGG